MVQKNYLEKIFDRQPILGRSSPILGDSESHELYACPSEKLNGFQLRFLLAEEGASRTETGALTYTVKSIEIENGENRETKSGEKRLKTLKSALDNGGYKTNALYSKHYFGREKYFNGGERIYLGKDIEKGSRRFYKVDGIWRVSVNNNTGFGYVNAVRTQPYGFVVYKTEPNASLFGVIELISTVR